MKRLVFAICILLSFCSCSSNKKGQEKEESVNQLVTAPANEVEIQTLKKTTFNHELISNGTLSSARIANLKFKTSEPVIKIFVKNGDFVPAGKIIAQLDTFSLNNRLQQALFELEGRKLDLQDVLIGQGYSIKDKNIPEEVMKLAEIRSGYSRALSAYKMVENERNESILRAPFAGVVANLFTKEFSTPDASKPFCTIIDTSNSEVIFPVLENEIAMLHIGDKIEVTPFSQPDVKAYGVVRTINPFVDKNGMVQITAKITSNAKLIEGMNLRINVFRSIPDQWVVPKSAVVLRSGKPVLFTLKNGKAVWNYIETGYENSTSYTITGKTLEEGDTVITTGTLNLADESPVKVVEHSSKKEND